MKYLRRVALTIATLMLSSSLVDARSRTAPSSRTVLVHGYVRANGTVVAPYFRSPPNTFSHPSELRSHAQASQFTDNEDFRSYVDVSSSSSKDSSVSQSPVNAKPVALPKPEFGIAGIKIGMNYEEVLQHTPKLCEASPGNTLLCGDPDRDGVFVTMSDTTPSIVVGVLRGVCSTEALPALIENYRAEIGALSYSEADTQQVFYRMQINYKGILAASGFCFSDDHKIESAHYHIFVSYAPLYDKRKGG